MKSGQTKSSERKMAVILHEKSFLPTVHTAVKNVRELGHSLEVHVTHEPGEATVYASEAKRKKADVVVAGGGDGTVNAVLNGLLHTDDLPPPSLAVMPLGSANDFAGGCEIPSDPYQALLLAAGGTATMVDVGKVNDRFFLNVVSCGFGAEISASTPAPVKKVLGGSAYSLYGVLKAIKMHPFQYKMAFSESEENGKAIILVVANGRQTGGGYAVAPNAFLDDGLLDVVLVREFPLYDLNVVGRELSQRGQINGRYIFSQQLSSLSIDMTEEISITVDGELLYEKSLDFTVLPRRLPLILPPNSPLIKQQKPLADSPGE